MCGKVKTLKNNQASQTGTFVKDKVNPQFQPTLALLSHLRLEVTEEHLS